LKIKYNIVGDIFDETLAKFFKSRWNFFSSNQNGIILNTLNKELVVIADAIGHMGTIFVQFVQLVVFLTIPLFINYKMVLISFVLASLFTIPTIFIRKYAYKLGENNTKTNNQMMSTFVELLSLSKLILAFGKQENTTKKFNKVFQDHKEVTLKYQFLSRSIPIVFQPFGISAVILGLVFSSSFGGNISELASVVWSMLRSIPFLGALVQSKVTIDTFIPSYNQLLRLQKSANDNKEINLNNQLFIRLEKDIKFNNIEFSYGESKVLRNISLVIPSGKTTAITGHSGSGKSTLIDILLGLQIPEGGKMLLDNIEYNKFDLKSIRSKIGYVPQDPVLFNDTIKNNLLWSNPDASEQDILDACKLSSSLDFIKELPLGFDTIVGDRGSNLSGGQRQRISLARALVKKPTILILDEATSSLDNESEFLIKESIDSLNGKMTILLIAHRLSTIAKADLIYVISKGQVIEQGNYRELISSGGELYKLSNI
jgi:ATP-binding cassette subfamily B protein